MTGWEWTDTGMIFRRADGRIEAIPMSQEAGFALDDLVRAKARLDEALGIATLLADDVRHAPGGGVLARAERLRDLLAAPLFDPNHP